MHRLSALELNKKFLSGELKAEEIVSYFLKRIEKIDPSIKAFLTTFPEKALKQAKEQDVRRQKGDKLGRLAGVPIAIKDNIHIEGELTTCGSRFLTNFKAPFSATAIRLLAEEDAIFIGKTNLDEFAMGSSTENSSFFPTNNPWDLTCTPGGSSGGSAAAVAARLVPLALGSDTGGSVRQPASFTGIVGYKPTYGRVSRYGLVAFGSSLDQISPFAHNVEDIALLMEIMGRPCEKDSTSLQEEAETILPALQASLSLKGVKVGVPYAFLEGLKGDAKKTFEATLTEMKNQGCELIEVDLSLLKYVIAVYYILATAEASTNLARFDGIRYGNRSKKARTLDEVYDFSKDEGYGLEVKRRILLGTYVLSAGYQDAYYKQAQKVRTRMIEQFEEAFRKTDIIAMPVAPTGAFTRGSIQDPLEMYLADIYTIASNLTGTPSISIPCGFVDGRKPFGLQFIGPQREDGRVIAVAHAFAKGNETYKQMPQIAE